MIVYTTKVIFLKCQILIFFLFCNVKNEKSRCHGKRKNANIKRKICTEKRINTSQKDLSKALKGTATLIKSIFYQKELYEPLILIQKSSKSVEKWES